MNMPFWKSGVSVLLSLLAALRPAPAVEPEAYVGDPRPEDRPTMHVQPPAVPASLRSSSPMAPASVVNGITYLDVMLSAGFDIGGADYGNETAITANPLNPNQIVLTSFSGSDWGSGGNASYFYSSNAGANWSYVLGVPRPTGTTTNINCPCDQTMDWGRDGQLYGTFLFYGVDGLTSSVYSAQTTTPAVSGSWVYRAPEGAAQTTNLPAVDYPDQPWLRSGPLPGDNSKTHVSVAYDSFDAGYINSQIRAADSPGDNPLNFTRDAAVNLDFQQYNDGMNPGNRIAVGPDGKIYNVFQRLIAVESGGVKQLTYLISVSSDGGLTWSVANADHFSGAKIIANNVYSFQGNGSKVGGVNALLGGVDAVTVDKTGAVWVVYGARATLASHDQLFLVKVTNNAGALTVGTPVTLSSSTVDSYLPAVAALPNGEVGVLFLTLNGANFQWRFQQYTNGATLNKSTGFPVFTSPFASNGASNQRIFGDYVQVRAVGCTYYGAYPARGAGASSINSIDPYFMSAPSQAPCTLNTLTSLSPPVVCAGEASASIGLLGTGFANGVTGRSDASLRNTTYLSPTQAMMTLVASDIAAPGTRSLDVLGPAPAGGLTGSLPLTVEAAAASPGASLRLAKSGTVDLSWSVSSGATSYTVHRCDASSGPCDLAAVIANPLTNTYPDPVLLDGNSYWYAIDSVNSCGSVP